MSLIRQVAVRRGLGGVGGVLLGGCVVGGSRSCSEFCVDGVGVVGWLGRGNWRLRWGLGLIGDVLVGELEFGLWEFAGFILRRSAAR